MSPAAGSEIALGAVDLGASSGRVIVGRVGPDRLDLDEVHRFRNGAVRLPDGLYWDVLGLYQDVLAGIGAAHRRTPELAGLAVDSWAVDYALVDGDGRLVGNPRHYRDPRNEPAVRVLQDRVTAETLYRINGLQHLPFTTVYQLTADRDALTPGRQALLIPDLLGYWLTGVRVTELTNASTTGLLDARTGGWSAELFAALDLSTDLLPSLVSPGVHVGELTAAVVADTGLDRPLPVTTVGSHDTASAVLGVPALDERFAYISCGTWGLVGVELTGPVLTDAGRAANFTNERGVDGTIRYLRNVMGLWLLSESLRTWALQGHEVDLNTVLTQAAALPAGGPRIDPDDPVFLAPGDMPSRIAAACRAAGDPVPGSVAQTVRCILDSLAGAFADGVRTAEELSGVHADTIHLVGGGSRNALLCQLTADAAGRPVVAGPVEATALGNLLVQARTHGAITGDRWDLRRHLVASGPELRTYLPRPVQR